MINSVYRKYENYYLQVFLEVCKYNYYYPQVFLEECKYVVKERRMSVFIIDKIEIFSDDSDKEDYDEENWI